MEIAKLYRVQGGIFPSRSRELIRVDGSAISCNPLYDIYFGDEVHLHHFLKVRSKARGEGNLPRKIGDFGLEVVEIYVPKLFLDLMETYSVRQFNSKSHYPKRVDPNTPGKSYQLTQNWAKLLEQVCLFAKNTPVLCREDYESIIAPPVLMQTNFISTEQVEKTLDACEVTKLDAIRFVDMLSLSLQPSIFENGKKSEVLERC